MAAGLGADVSILDRSLPRLRQLDDIFNGRVHTRYSTIDALEEEVFSADMVIGAVLIPGAAAPKLVTREMLSAMKKGAVIVDVAIDQGGCFETSHATTHSEPTYEVEGIVHYCVANMPGAGRSRRRTRSTMRHSNTDCSSPTAASRRLPKTGICAPASMSTEAAYQCRRGRSARLRRPRSRGRPPRRLTR